MTYPLVRHIRTADVLVLILFGCTFGLTSCSFFAGKPPLPKHASIEHLRPPAGPMDYAALIGGADVIYFPTERAASGARAEPAALLLEALEKSARPFGVAWDLIDASQQPLLDQLPSTGGNAREKIIAQLALEGSGRAREHCRLVLRDFRTDHLSLLALRFPAALMAKIDSRESLTQEDKELLPRGYALPEGGLGSYAERARARDPSSIVTSGSYRIELVRHEFAAEKIVRYLRAAPATGKLLVFAADADLRSEDGVPFFVAQKSHARQLLLGPEPTRARDRLLTSDVGRGAFQVVDRAPAAARD